MRNCSNAECGIRNTEFVHSLYFFAKFLGMMHKIRKDEQIPQSAFEKFRIRQGNGFQG
jgi:hypothetical protein